jgi:hypothetical protein
MILLPHVGHRPSEGAIFVSAIERESNPVMSLRLPALRNGIKKLQALASE